MADQRIQRQRERVKTLLADKAISEVAIAAKLPASTFQQSKSISNDSKDRINKLTVKKAYEFTKTNLATINLILTELGLPNLGDLEVTIGEFTQENIDKFLESYVCPNREFLEQILNTRTLIGDQADKLADFLQVVDSSLSTLNSFLTQQINTVELVRLLKLTTSQVTKLVPSPPGTPGAVTALLSDAESFINLITFTATGSPKLETAQAVLVLGQLYFQQALTILVPVLNGLDVLDAILAKCLQTPKSANRLKQLAASQLQSKPDQAENYQGFTFIVESEQVGETLSRKKAVALNANGIPVLETAWSFTTKPQLLYEQLKFSIDSQNLKAN